MDKEYKCDRCANRCAIVCNECTYVTAPDGTESKPKYYIEYSTRFNDVEPDELRERYAHLLMRQLEAGGALPFAVVMEYNKRIEEQRESTKG